VRVPITINNIFNNTATDRIKIASCFIWIISASCSITIIGSGRTDSGVHAKGHAVNFKTKSLLPKSNIMIGANSYLPADIVILRITQVALSFHARFSAKKKCYCYAVLNAGKRSPLLSRYTYQVTYPLNVEAMQRAAKVFIGRHDFKAFGRQCHKKDNTTRTLYELNISKRGAVIHFNVVGDGFLYMVRNIVGTLIDVGRGKKLLKDVCSIMRSRNRVNAGPTVPPQGLTLMHVYYR